MLHDFHTDIFFQERVKAWQAFQALSMNLNKKREAKVKAELAQRMDKISILRQGFFIFLTFPACFSIPIFFFQFEF